MAGATPFTSFVQLELPKRPYLENDIEENSVLIRKGQGARSLGGVKLEDGQILTSIEGELVAVDLADVTGDTDNHAHVQESAAVLWPIQHNGDSINCNVSVYNDQGYIVQPESVRIVDANNIEITFLSAVTGRAVITYF